MAKSPEEYAHLEWLGYVQPIGLIVSVPAMLEAQCYINKNIIGEHARFLECLPRGKNDEVIPEITDFAAFAAKCLEWEAEDLVELLDASCQLSVRDDLTVALPQYNEVLRPTHVVLNFQPDSARIDESDTSNQQLAFSSYLMLIQQLPTGTDFDEPSEADSSRHWHAAPQLKFERLLRESQVPIGLLSNCRQLRLVYAPRGESSGHATFNVDEMVQVAGRPMFAALHMLLSADRMFTLGEKQRLPSILANSRKYQNTVSTKLAEQVLAALYELMRGFQSANDVRKGELLREVLASDPNQVYSGLLRVLMRLVFVLYAEDRDLMSGDSVYSNNYSVSGLFERLREDAGRFPDTMDSRFGAWSQLLTLFRLVFEGGQHATFKLPPRKGYLFDPGRYPFLEGRTASDTADEPGPVPRISDGVVYRVLRNLLILDGERLSYRTLDVEQIGSVYETMMGFNLEVARGQAIAIKPVKSHGAPATINLDELLATKGKDRAKWIKEQTDQKITGEALKSLKAAESIDDLLVALDKKIAKKVTPRVVLAGSIVLQPSDERRRSGSHYTPRSLTKPIVETTLAPILKQLVEPPQEEADGEKTLFASKGRKTKLQAVKSERDEEAFRLAQEKGSPHPRQILDLKVCDPAMGSGAFLVETCRQLGDELVAAWHAHECIPTADIPPDEDEILYARRLIAQRCLYGVDKNPMAVDLTKLSLWLATLAKDHPFTFLDHSLRHGDSLVGLNRRQIVGFHWEPKKQKKFGEELIERRLERATEARAKILDAREDVPYRDQEQRLVVADEALDLIRTVGDACVSAFFGGQQPRERDQQRDKLFGVATEYLQSLESREELDFSSRTVLATAATSTHEGDYPLSPFHWDIEFPEVFANGNDGFDAFVGNPPFLGCYRISEMAAGPVYQHWLKTVVAPSKGQVDLSVFFFHRSFSLLRERGTFGLLATGTVSFGDNRTVGLAQLISQGGIIYSATTRMPWPGEASVLVSIVHVCKGDASLLSAKCFLDKKPCKFINSRLQPHKEMGEPQVLVANAGLAHTGTKIGSSGFVLENDEASRFLADPKNKPVILTLIGGEEVNAPAEANERFVISFGRRTLDEAEAWPELLDLVRDRVLPQRMKARNHGPGAHGKKYWWQHLLRADHLYVAIEGLSRCLVTSQVSTHHAVRFESAARLFNHKVFVFAFDSHAAFAILQSTVHALWSLEHSSRHGFAVNYSISKTFATFPFPDEGWQEQMVLQSAGRVYCEYRENLMEQRNDGLTDTYNRFHDPDETSPEIKKLRDLHGEMDRAVLRAYGWDDLAEQATCDFLLDYEEEEDDDPTAKKSKKKKPWRYRWPDEFRDEVLARLLELNEQRAMEEKLAGKTAEAQAKKSAGSNGRGKKATTYAASKPTPLFEKEGG